MCLLEIDRRIMNIFLNVLNIAIDNLLIYSLFDIAKKSHAPHNPVARANVAFKVD